MTQQVWKIEINNQRDCRQWGAILRRAVASTAKDDTRVSLQHVQICIVNNQLRIVSADGFRLAIFQYLIEPPAEVVESGLLDEARLIHQDDITALGDAMFRSKAVVPTQLEISSVAPTIAGQPTTLRMEWNNRGTSVAATSQDTGFSYPAWAQVMPINHEKPHSVMFRHMLTEVTEFTKAIHYDRAAAELIGMKIDPKVACRFEARGALWEGVLVVMPASHDSGKPLNVDVKDSSGKVL